MRIELYKSESRSNGNSSSQPATSSPSSEVGASSTVETVVNASGMSRRKQQKPRHLDAEEDDHEDMPDAGSKRGGRCCLSFLYNGVFVGETLGVHRQFSFLPQG